MSLPYFPMFPSDFEAKTSHLSMDEDGAYNRLLRICWMTPGCSMPADEAWIMRRARAMTEADKEAIRSVLAEFFTVENGRYSNAKLLRIWREANEAHEKRKNAGARGGKAKALKTNKTGHSNARAMLKQPEPEPYIKEEPKGSSKKQRRKTSMRDDAVISDRMLAAADKRGLSLQEAEAQFEKFKNDALAKGKTFVDWDRAFVTWLDSPYFRPVFQLRAIPGGRSNEPFDLNEEIRRGIELSASSRQDSFLG